MSDFDKRTNTHAYFNPNDWMKWRTPYELAKSKKIVRENIKAQRERIDDDKKDTLGKMEKILDMLWKTEDNTKIETKKIKKSTPSIKTENVKMPWLEWWSSSNIWELQARDNRLSKELYEKIKNQIKK